MNIMDFALALPYVLLLMAIFFGMVVLVEWVARTRRRRLKKRKKDGR